MIRLALALILLAGHARAMDFTVRGRAVWATGQIETGDSAKFAAILTGAKAERVVVNSTGGRIADADAMAAMIRMHKMGVTVAGQCASACFLMFAAGSPRSVVGRSQIGVHSANIDGDESVAAMASTVYEARRAATLGATHAAIAKLVTTPPSGITYLTDADLAEMGVRFVAAP